MPRERTAPPPSSPSRPRLRPGLGRSIALRRPHRPGRRDDGRGARRERPAAARRAGRRGWRTLGVVARVDAQLRQHRHPRPPRRPARGWWRCRRCARRSALAPARQALASVVRRPYPPEVDERQVDEIAGRHAAACAQRPIGVGEHQAGVVEHVRRRERPGSDGQDGEARIEVAAGHLLEQHAVVGPLAELEREVGSDPRQVADDPGQETDRGALEDPQPQLGALEADRLEVGARGHEPGSDLVDVLQKAKAGRRDADRSAPARPLHERLAHEPLEARHLPAERGQAVPETVGRRTERSGPRDAAQGHEVAELDALPGLIEILDHSGQYIRLFLTPGVCQCGPRPNEEQNDASPDDRPGGPRAVSDRRPRRPGRSRPACPLPVRARRGGRL